MTGRPVPFAHAGPIVFCKRRGSSCEAEIGPECVKTLSYIECVIQAFLGDAIAQAFSVISITDVPKRLCSG
jgi:hypothetical protein